MHVLRTAHQLTHLATLLAITTSASSSSSVALQDRTSHSASARAPEHSISAPVADAFTRNATSLLQRSSNVTWRCPPLLPRVETHR